MRTGIAVACAAFGLVALPALLASRSLTPIWLFGEVLLAIAILALMPALSRALADAIALHTRAATSVTTSQTRLIGHLLLLSVTLIVVQAMLRRPLALTAAGDPRVAASLEAHLAALVLTLVLGLSVWLFQTARPVVQSLTLRAIDAAVPTVGTALAIEQTLPTTSIDSEATVLAPRRPTDAEATIAADPDITVRVRRPRP